MVVDITSNDLGKRAAAARALEFVKSGMILGLGTGSTAAWFVKLLAEKIITEGLVVSCVPTSRITRDQAYSLKIPLTTLEKTDFIDLVVDGTDEFDLDFNLIKGGGGALLQEKIVASAAKHMLVITDSSKESLCLGSFDLPVEIVKFGASSTKRFVENIVRDLGYHDVCAKYRKNADNERFVTDEGHLIIDLALQKINEVSVLQDHLIKCAGVVETGLFLGMAKTIVVGNSDGSCKLIGVSKIGG